MDTQHSAYTQMQGTDHPDEHRELNVAFNLAFSVAEKEQSLEALLQRQPSGPAHAHQDYRRLWLVRSIEHELS